MNFRPYYPYTIVLGLFVLFLLLYTAYDKTTKTLVIENLVRVVSFQDHDHSLRELNKVIALEAIGLISITLLLGPLSKFMPRIFTVFLYMRKPLGIAGFVLAAAHGIYSAAEVYQLDINQMIFQNSKAWGLVSAIIALAIFFIMTITSTKEAVARMGYKKWKTLQTFGYAGLFFAILHFFIFESKPGIGLDVRPFGLLFFYLGIAALLLKLLSVLLSAPERESFGEHFGEK
jgi:DMSO/TMAO reductase YedYZ heme-binding membrane subunit